MCVAVPGGPAISVRSSRPIGTVVTIALRPESVKVDVPDGTQDAEPKINEVDALVEKIVYHGFISHLYLRQNNGDPLIVFRQNETGASPPIAPGKRVRACWSEESNHIVRDEAGTAFDHAAE